MLSPAFAEVYGDASTKRYHSAECPETPVIQKKSLKTFAAEAEARAKGFYPCPLCSPLARKDATVTTVQQRKLSATISRGEGFVVDKATKTYHSAWCSQIKNIDPKQMLKVQEIEKASEGGNQPCSVCNPPVAFVRTKIPPTPVTDATLHVPPKPPSKMGSMDVPGEKEKE
jgi:methylphosphotriester-DNA--protein-cysteine methyltransferase